MSKEGSQLTTWQPVDQMLESEYGYVPYSKWCVLEIGRMRAKQRAGVEYTIKERGENIAIFKKVVGAPGQ